MSEQKLLDVKNLEVIYKTDLETVYAVNGISFSMDKGESLGIVGETGAGKTTTALSIMSLLPERTARAKGEILLEGRDMLSIPERERRSIRGKEVAMIFQDPMTSLNPVITIGDQIKESLEIHNTEGKSDEELEARVEETLRLVGIPPERKIDFPHQFSGGMKQRVVIAIALACEPDLLIADEPTTALDVTIQAQVLMMIKQLREKLGTSLIMITHDLGIVAQTCFKVAVMYAGEFIEYGTTEEVFDSPYRHPYTIGLFGSIPDLEEKSSRLHPIDGLMPDPTDLPKGCKFSPRCPHATDRCRSEVPQDIYLSETHYIKCFLFEKEAAK
ncbi:MAG: ABC transporter ATP-binding protein [Firmicutes bacterium]|nr:ABC transporter ATP-binding protein [Bacillota bacterium]